ncbi:MAG: bifunctional phosphoribosylaminoimidazolecarboxamide formyltransferase/IMP cyclohydrolase [Planctomycetota bacterium]|jgi:phosphoribosylaminoimidazolecarboxamide formyltransferase/IMP cyclohydrolase|nr:bifunctional phosphoribosylaminoimidazolecarboxamide formyltransferase/IMP cyclohydrolase [Planctomycetota bacterium]MDP6990286.1 bifunctional phosphoribosylaminoimidazolecarboxamide formyltransferase/IMP cyclohydrolase [Planctomycetota bacterium]
MTTKIRRALISVSDKSNIENFARALSQMGVELVSTGGTHAKLSAAGIPVREVSDVTGFPEMMNGRVKTLHPMVHGGLLALRDEPSHLQAMESHGIGPIDLAVVNLYPFEETAAREGVTRSEAVEQIDIGGPSMVRSAAKNHRFVGIVTDPGDYGRVLDEMERLEGGLSDELRRELAVKAFALTARYDAAISRWLFEQECEAGLAPSPFPETFAVAGRKVSELRYGENPHQSAAFYRASAGEEPSAASAEVLSGKALSYNNYVDLDAALALAKEFDEPFVAVTKHNNPCGAAGAEAIEDALAMAWEGDPLSAFGSVLAFTRPVNLASAEFLVSGNRFVEAIIAPSFEEDAFDLLTGKPRWGKSVRLLACGEFGPRTRSAGDIEMKKMVGGFLLQERDLTACAWEDCTVKTQEQPDSDQIEGLLFAEKIAKHVKSNAIVLTKGRRVLGVGAGQMSRVDAVRMAVHKAGDEVAGSVLASDAFFPFPDGIETAVEAGVGAILQPGGSVRDEEVIAACDRVGAVMVFTGARHFRH